MALPKQAQQDQADVEAYEKTLLEQAAEPVAGQTPSEVVTETPPEDVPEKVVPAEPVVEKPAVVEPEEPWKQRYLTLKGMFDAETPRLHAQVKELMKEVAALTEAAKKAPVPEVTPTSSVTDEEEQAFGKDLIDVQRRIAKEAVAPIMAQVKVLETENTALRELLGKTGSRVETMSFEQKLQATVPDFEQVNADPKWVAWLDEVDPILRGPRRYVAQAAFENGDAEAVAEYVKLFRAMTTKPAAPVPDKNEAELRSQVAPNRTVAAPAPEARESGKFYTEAEASKAFDRVSALNRAGKYEEASKLEADVTAAYNAGRVR